MKFNFKSFIFIFTALDKLGLRPNHSSPFAGMFGSSSSINGTGPVEPALPNTVFDVASLALYGCQALPIRLKILLDRLFSVLPPEDVVQVLTGFGWSLEDYARGYILQVTKRDKFVIFFKVLSWRLEAKVPLFQCSFKKRKERKSCACFELSGKQPLIKKRRNGVEDPTYTETHTKESDSFPPNQRRRRRKRGPNSSNNISHPHTCLCVQPVYLLLASVIISITRPSSTIYLRLVMTLIFGEAKKRNGLKMYCCLSPTSRRHSCKSLAWLWTTTTAKANPLPKMGIPSRSIYLQFLERSKE